MINVRGKGSSGIGYMVGYQVLVGLAAGTVNNTEASFASP